MKSPSEITRLEIIEAVRGPITRPIEVVETTKGAPVAKKMETLFDKATEEALKILRKATRAQVLK